ncbi:protein of unknown function [Candidatus Nitrotoga arctica]|uniref:Uncharacterized protein n=1 Tax=Candidatus Nitrotoga arctica TaxID=453162 RepID=A0ABN8AMP8_9PROT|nr:protein of unknown function [Candidatus Nitrotoga arctica]
MIEPIFVSNKLICPVLQQINGTLLIPPLS